MMEAFTDLKLPSLPRKFHLFMTDTDVEERQFAFDCLLKVCMPITMQHIHVPTTIF